MTIFYSYGNWFKREGELGQKVCSNCGHTAEQTLCRHTYQIRIFGIPIWKQLKHRGIMCESCGNIVPLDKQEYREEKSAARDKM